jgi:hypothetical protein
VAVVGIESCAAEGDSLPMVSSPLKRWVTHQYIYDNRTNAVHSTTPEIEDGLEPKVKRLKTEIGVSNQTGKSTLDQTSPTKNDTQQASVGLDKVNNGAFIIHQRVLQFVYSLFL